MTSSENQKDQKEQTDQKKPETPAKKGDKKEEKEEELSEEDIQLKKDIELLVERACGETNELLDAALEGLREQIKSSTGTMTAIPKALKFLRPHYPTLVAGYEKLEKSPQKKKMADILSILAMTMSKPGSRDTLHLKLAGDPTDVESWGHEYVRCLSAEIGDEYTQRQADNQPTDDLLSLVELIVPFDMKHNAEPEACDLLMEVDKLERIIDQIDTNNYKRVCLYLLNCTYYVAEPEDTEILRIVLKIYRKVEQTGDALRVAMRLNDKDIIQEIYGNCSDRTTKKQLACLLARQHVYLEEEDEELKEILYNTNLSKYFLSLGRDLDIMEPKAPEDIYKTLGDSRAITDSARNNLAATFVNAFVNAGFGVDKFMTTEGNKWVYKNKDHGMMSAAASLGMIMLWGAENGITQLDKFTYSREDTIKGGALLGTGVVSCGVRDEFDTALNLLREHVSDSSTHMRIGAILGLGIAYSGSAREELIEILLPVLEDSTLSMEIIGITGLSLGLIFAGTSNPDITSSIMDIFFEREESVLNNTHTRFLCLGLGLLYLGTQELADLTLETLKTIQGPYGQYCSLTVETCAYAATGNVLKIQKLLDICGDHLDEKKNDSHQSVAVLGIALIAMGEELGAEMSLRSFDHLLQYGEPVVRRAVPLALGLLCVSNPLVNVMDTLGKLSHDSDEEVSLTAILALGFIGAGTNNARIAAMLRQLSQFYGKQASHLFVTKLAQGLLHLGKGTMTLNPFHSDRLLLSNVGIGGLLTVLHAGFDLSNTILNKTHYLLYTLTTAMYPRMLMTFDEEMKPITTSVRVGQAVDTVGQAGKPKTITGFQTHTTPVLIATKERAELATDEYIPVTSVLEGFVILRKNPDSLHAQTSTKK